MPPDPDILIDFTNAASVSEAEITALTLRAAGIPAYVSTTAGIWNPWELASSNPYRIAVRRADLVRARDAIRDAKADSADSIDWDQLDVGQPDPSDAPASIAAHQARPITRRWSHRFTLILILITYLAPTILWTYGTWWGYALTTLVALGILGLLLSWLAKPRPD